jgi:peptidylprolyl isomerase domain and WD repeat-containing protein 1
MPLCCVLLLLLLLLQKGDAASKLAISDLNSANIYVYDVASGSEEPIATLSTLHSSPVAVMRYNAPANTVISSDTKGVQQSCCHKKW